jgi:hypothetical protein
MRREGNTVYVSEDDAATLRQIADEYGLPVRAVELLLELGDDVDRDVVLRPRVAGIYRLALESLGAATTL